NPKTQRDRALARGKDLVAKKDYNRAILEFRNALTVAPKDPEVYYELGMTFLAMQEYVQGVNALQRATVLDPKYVPAQLKMAELMAATSDPDVLKEAESRLALLTQTAPDMPEVLDTLALTKFKEGKTEDALALLEKVLAANPNEPNAQIML